ncbi:MAG: response regulator [Candidatus Omnitrophica bacterium]|nr:response regulator [Candidatus Omnitrophota bacterium]
MGSDSTDSKRILLVDDDVLVLKSLSRALKAKGYEVVSAQSGEDALTICSREKIDLIICDIRMPEMSGRETLHKIRHECYVSVPAIMITGYAGNEDLRKSDDLGIIAFLYKPFDIQDLLQRVDSYSQGVPGHARAYSRVTVSLPLTVKYGTPQENELHCQTKTLSEEGLSFYAPQEISPDTNIEVSVDFQGCILVLAGRIVWNSKVKKESQWHHGVQFLQIDQAQRKTLQTTISAQKEISQRFIAVTQKLKNNLARVQKECGAFDRSEPSAEDTGKFVVSQKQKIFPEVSKAFYEIWDIVHGFDQDKYVMYQDYFREEILPFLGYPQINKRIYYKPIGYAGDFLVMEYIYNYNGQENFLGDSSFEKLVNHFTCNIPVTNANIVRKNYLKQKIKDAAQRNNSAKVLSVGSGSGRELVELLEEQSLPAGLCFTALDLEPLALDFLKEQVFGVAREKREIVHVEFINMDIIALIRQKNNSELLQENDLVYVSGVYDYLHDRIARLLLQKLFELVRPGGQLVVCNISSEKQFLRAYYEFLGGWDMIYRNREKMMSWVEELPGVKSAVFEEESDENRYHFLSIKKE